MTGRFPRRDLAMHVDEGPMLETLDYTIRIGSTPTFLYFDLYLYSAYAAHCIYLLLVPFLYMEIIWQGRFSSRHGKAGQFLSHKHSLRPASWRRYYADFAN